LPPPPTPRTASATPRPVYLTRVAHCSALGLGASAAAASLLAAKISPSSREFGGIAYPWFALPLARDSWENRARQALSLVGAELGLNADRDAGLPLFIGSSSLQAGAIEAQARARGAVDLPADAAAFATDVAHWLGMRATPWTFSTGCTSGLAALEAAMSLIGCGEIDQALVLGIELANDTTLAGFASLGLLAPTPDDDGIILGEAVAGLRLDVRPTPGRPNWKIAACCLGIDGHAPTAPSPDGHRIAALMTTALNVPGITAGESDRIKLHQGRLASTDAAENAALARVFGDALHAAPYPPRIALKRALGHTLGASGPAELSALLALLDTPAGQTRYANPQRLLFNLIGFGGSIAEIVVSREG
jgi:3-oxoacyl-[acyl-carrier-protein] synthase-1